MTACLSCNSSKQDLSLQAWLVVLQDRGVDVAEIPSRIRRHTARALDLQAAKALLAARS